MDINYELYKVFYHVAKSLSFSDAAQELFISQSAVSQSIKVLERRLGQTLFIRSTKKVTLTKEGEILFKHIEPAINLIVKGEGQLLSAKESGGRSDHDSGNRKDRRYKKRDKKRGSAAIKNSGEKIPAQLIRSKDIAPGRRFQNMVIKSLQWIIRGEFSREYDKNNKIA